MIPMTALVAFTALALTTSATPVEPRDNKDGIPQPLGLDQGNLYSELTFTTYADPHCDNEGSAWRGAYGFYNAKQMKSYRLSRALQPDEVLDFFTGDGTGLPSRYSVDLAMDGDYEEACQRYDSTAGVNATTHDSEGHGRWKGCHDLNNNEWCASIWLMGNV